MNDPDVRQGVLDCSCHALVLGGPGSGKTTLALRKAVLRIRAGIGTGQNVLFLSFSRAAVARIADAAKLDSTASEQKQLTVQTFHSFFWDVVRVHGYLLGAPRTLSLLLPQDEKALSGSVKRDTAGWPAWETERERMFREEGKIAFDLFAPKAVELLQKSALLRQSLASKFPLVIVDEAQDTGNDSWAAISLLAPLTQVIGSAAL